MEAFLAVGVASKYAGVYHNFFFFFLTASAACGSSLDQGLNLHHSSNPSRATAVTTPDP